MNIKGNEKDCICHKPKGKHVKYCDAFRMSEFFKRVSGVLYSRTKGKKTDLVDKLNN